MNYRGSIEFCVDQFLEELKIDFTEWLIHIRQPLIALFQSQYGNTLNQKWNLYKTQLFDSSQRFIRETKEQIIFISSFCNDVQLEQVNEKTQIKIAQTKSILVREQEEITQEEKINQLNYEQDEQVKPRNRISIGQGKQEQFIDLPEAYKAVMKKAGIKKKDLKDPIVIQIVIDAVRQLQLTESSDLNKD